MMRSVLTDRFGYVVTTLHEGPMTDRTPMDERLGGWYVTGTQPEGHAGNVLAPELVHEISDKQGYLDAFDMNAQNNVTDLNDRFDTSIYLSAHSDIAALLVMSHQTRVHNLITNAHQSSRDALRDQEAVLRTTGGEALAEGELTPAAEVRIDGAVERLVRELLFVREAPLGGPIEGTSGFTEEFMTLGPYDDQGRSLRDFNLDTRLFEYPLSFLIYTEAFDALPEMVKTKVFGRVNEILDGNDVTGSFAHLTEVDRTAIREILAATKPEFLVMQP
jgi:hypothetical protein